MCTQIQRKEGREEGRKKYRKGEQVSFHGLTMQNVHLIWHLADPKPRAQKLNPGFSHRWQAPNCLRHHCYFPWSALAQSWSWELELSLIRWHSDVGHIFIGSHQTLLAPGCSPSLLLLLALCNCNRAWVSAAQQLSRRHAWKTGELQKARKYKEQEGCRR